jgi:hypothetical protein
MSTQSDIKPLVVRPKRAMAMLADCSKPTLQGLIKSGKIKSFLEGRARWIEVQSIEQYVARKVAEQPQPPKIKNGGAHVGGATMEQVPTRGVTTAKIMASRAFQRGLDDARAGIGFDSSAFADDIDDAWDNERGRHFAHIAPLDMKLRIRGMLNPKALALCRAAFGRGYIR